MKKHYYHKLTSWYDPEHAFTTLYASAPAAFWLDTSLPNDENRFSYMGLPEEIISYKLQTNTVTIEKDNHTTTTNQNVFAYLDKHLPQPFPEEKPIPFPFIGGYVGYFGYELKALSGAKNSYASSYPDSIWFKVEKFIVFDHHKKVVYLVCLTKEKQQANEWFTVIEKNLKAPKQSQEDKKLPRSFVTRNDVLKASKNKSQYLQDIQTAKKHLTKGESYQICLTNTLSTKTTTDPLSLYRALRKSNPAPYAAYIRYNDLTILCSSPEQFLKINSDGTVITKPIKGTIARGSTLQEDTLLKKQLAESHKDWSENAMIVDLLRNDLGKVCDFGSIQVTKQMAIESYHTVHQMVSTIQGKLRKNTTTIDAIKACFPGGSMTGAPKIRTMEILEALEKQARGIYSGSIGFLSYNKTASLNIVIRTMVIQKGELSIGAGGAILIDSDPEKEYEEMILKTKALQNAVQNSLKSEE